MKGLLLKDVYLLKRFGRIYAVMLIAYTAISIFTDSSGFIMGVNVSMFSLLPFTLISQDYSCHWDGYAVTTPVSRRDIAIEKYIVLVGMWGIGLAITLAVGVMTYLINPEDFPMEDTWATMAGLTLMIFFNNSITIPTMLKFGPEKGRLIMMGSLIIPMLGIVVLIKFLPEFFGMLGALLGAVGVLILMFVISIRLSVRIMEKLDVS